MRFDSVLIKPIYDTSKYKKYKLYLGEVYICQFWEDNCKVVLKCHNHMIDWDTNLLSFLCNLIEQLQDECLCKKLDYILSWTENELKRTKKLIQSLQK